MSDDFKPVTLEEIESVWGNSNFGDGVNNQKMHFVKKTLWKIASGFGIGSTATSIMVELGLIEINKPVLTYRGKEQLWEFLNEKPILT